VMTSGVDGAEKLFSQIQKPEEMPALAEEQVPTPGDAEQLAAEKLIQ